jgi:cysteine synthase
MKLANHHFFKASDPELTRIVRISTPFPDWLNPFWKDDVVIRAACIPGELEHSKVYVAREILLGPIRDGLVTQDTLIKEATSGNTGQGLAKICKALGVRCQLIVPAGTARGKVNAISVMGGGIEVVLHSDPAETIVERARREGGDSGCFNPDQYGTWRNPHAHKKYLAPKLFQSAGPVSLLSVASGTMGTAMGLKQFVDEHGFSTQVVPVILEEHNEVPGARPLSKIEKDVRLPWKGLFSLADIERGTRHSSFLLAYYSWRFLPETLGPSFGLAYQGALRRLQKEKLSGGLGLLRIGGRVEVIIVGVDTYLPYLDLFLGELQSDERHSYKTPDILALAL